MPIGFAERLSFDFYNLVIALLGSPTCIPWLLFVLYYHKKYIYAIFTLLWAAYFIYKAYLFFSGEAKNSTETQMTGDPGPTNDFYIMNMLILSAYIFVGVTGYLRPEKVHNYRTSARGYVSKRF